MIMVNIKRLFILVLTCTLLFQSQAQSFNFKLAFQVDTSNLSSYLGASTFAQNGKKLVMGADDGKVGFELFEWNDTAVKLVQDITPGPNETVVGMVNLSKPATDSGFYVPLDVYFAILAPDQFAVIAVRLGLIFAHSHLPRMTIVV